MNAHRFGTYCRQRIGSGRCMPRSSLPNRLMTAFEGAEFIGCHEETVRRAYLRGLLVRSAGVRSLRHPRDVHD